MSYSIKILLVLVAVYVLPQRTASRIIIVFTNNLSLLFQHFCETVLVFVSRHIYELCFQEDLSITVRYLLYNYFNLVLILAYYDTFNIFALRNCSRIFAASYPTARYRGIINAILDILSGEQLEIA